MVSWHGTAEWWFWILRALGFPKASMEEESSSVVLIIHDHP
jgi:hypothetical protein